ncbi:MAG: photosynthetic complex putative assembly protein PuhB [Pseudomonadota bacterium]
MSHDDFQIEPIRGLPEVPPEGEKILWQGAPSWRALARDAFKLYWVAGYFVVMAVWRAVDVAAARTVAEGAQSAIPMLVLGAIACGIIALIAYVQAKTTVYTITNRRVAMRIGAALTVTLNLPYKWIGSVDLTKRRDGTGSIAMQLMGSTRLSYLVCWPHVRPWRMSKTEPTLRCIPDAEKIAHLLAESAQARLTEIALKPGEVEAAAPAHPVAAE